jgi:hypothetical protein
MNGEEERMGMKRRSFFTSVAVLIAGGSLFGRVFPGLARKALAGSQAPVSGGISVRCHPLAVPRTNVRSTSNG